MGKKPSVQVVRYGDLEPCFDAFIDTRTPGSDKKENFTIIGPGVSENPNQHVHITEPHGFNIGAARQPPGCVNSQHSHDTAEVFFVHTGTWSFDLGVDGTDAKITLKPGDLISIPTNLFRGFVNIGEDVGFLWAILGKDDPGHVLWAPDVFEMAKDYGLVLLENGNLIDTSKGEEIPDGHHPMPVTTAAQIAELQRLDNQALRACCILADEKCGGSKNDRPLIGPSAKLDWPHGFEVDQKILPGGEKTEAESYAGSEVIFLHEGNLSIMTEGLNIDLGKGDTATIAKGAERQYSNIGSTDAIYVVVRGNI